MSRPTGRPRGRPPKDRSEEDSDRLEPALIVADIMRVQVSVGTALLAVRSRNHLEAVGRLTEAQRQLLSVR